MLKTLIVPIVLVPFVPKMCIKNDDLQFMGEMGFGE